MHYDKNSHHSGSTEVVYSRRSDAFAAVKRYNNVLLDGRPMKIELVGANSEIPLSARVRVMGGNGGGSRTVVMMSGTSYGKIFFFHRKIVIQGALHHLIYFFCTPLWQEVAF